MNLYNSSEYHNILSRTTPTSNFYKSINRNKQINS